MPLMVWLKDIYQSGDIEEDVPFTHPTLHYGFLLLIHWGLKSILRVHPVQNMIQLWILLSLRLGLVLSSNTLKG